MEKEKYTQLTIDDFLDEESEQEISEEVNESDNSQILNEIQILEMRLEFVKNEGILAEARTEIEELKKKLK